MRDIKQDSFDEYIRNIAKLLSDKSITFSPTQYRIWFFPGKEF